MISKAVDRLYKAFQYEVISGDADPNQLAADLITALLTSDVKDVHHVSGLAFVQHCENLLTGALMVKGSARKL